MSWPRNAAAQSPELISAYKRYEQLSRTGDLDGAAKAARRALQLGLAEFGETHRHTVTFRVNLARLLMRKQQYRTALRLYTEALTAQKQLSKTPDAALATRHMDLGTTLHRLGRYSLAVASMKQALEIREQVYGPDNPKLSTTLSNLALSLRHAGNLQAAVQLYERAVAMLGPNPKPGTAAATLSNYAGLLKQMGRHKASERYYKRAIADIEASSGPDSVNSAILLDNLSTLYNDQGRYSEAEPLTRRALKIFEQRLGERHPSTATALNNLAAILDGRRAYKEAVELYERALAIRISLFGEDHPSVAVTMDNLGGTYRMMGDYKRAAEVRERSLPLFKKNYGDRHPSVATAMSNLGQTYELLGRDDDAAKLYEQVLATNREIYGEFHPTTSTAYDNFAGLYYDSGKFAEAIAFGRKSAASLIGYAERFAAGGTAQSSLMRRRAHVFRNWVRAAYENMRADRNNRALHDAMMGEAFIMAQHAEQSSAGAALSQMASRFGAGTSELAGLIRLSQDLGGQRAKLDRSLVTALSRQGRRDEARITALRARITELDGRLDGLAARIKSDFPEYARLTNPQPLKIAEVQAQLQSDEVMLLYLHVPRGGRHRESVFLWVIGKDTARWGRVELGGENLRIRVRALRCGLDTTAWQGKSADFCGDILNSEYSLELLAANGELPPFVLSRAHALFKSLIGGMKQHIDGRHALIVPSGPLAQLPFQVLVTAKPDPNVHGLAAYRKAAWFGKSQAMTVLPSVSSLKALRAVKGRQAPERPFIGIGNPLLTGPNGQDRRAWDGQECRQLQVAASQSGRVVRSSVALSASFYRGARADVELLRRQAPLPDTADELCSVAIGLGAGPEHVLLGANANEAAIKKLSTAGSLDDFGLVHFATHGLVAGEISGVTEPALLLTPPAAATADDDGLLTASEVAQLRLNADWVVLSACNTAAGQAGGAEALSGLARAFFYAGARALLVSHWAVFSKAAVEITTGAATAMRDDPTIGRAEALRKSMAQLIDHGEAYKAHPSYWAPFVVVGEGRR